MIEIVSAIRLLQSCHYVVLAPHAAGLHISQSSPLRIEFDSPRLTFSGAQIRLSPYHGRIVQALIDASDEWCSRETLSYAVWGDTKSRSNALAVHMFYVRQRLRRLTKMEAPLLSSRRQGFRLASELLKESKER
jgi:DNA-binding winged helix-turn-helix (wHTH) protein